MRTKSSPNVRTSAGRHHPTLSHRGRVGEGRNKGVGEIGAADGADVGQGSGPQPLGIRPCGSAIARRVRVVRRIRRSLGQTPAHQVVMFEPLRVVRDPALIAHTNEPQKAPHQICHGRGLPARDLGLVLGAGVLACGHAAKDGAREEEPRHGAYQDANHDPSLDLLIFPCSAATSCRQRASPGRGLTLAAGWNPACYRDAGHGDADHLPAMWPTQGGPRPALPIVWV